MLAEFEFHHIGYAVKNIDKTSAYYLTAGFVQTETIIDPLQNVRIAFLSKHGNPLIELVEPVDKHSPIVKTLEKSGVSPYHICYSVDDLDEAIGKMKMLKFIPLFKPVPAVALGNKKICYLYNQDVGLIELLEK